MNKPIFTKAILCMIILAVLAGSIMIFSAYNRTQHEDYGIQTIRPFDIVPHNEPPRDDKTKWDNK